MTRFNVKQLNKPVFLNAFCPVEQSLVKERIEKNFLKLLININFKK